MMARAETTKERTMDWDEGSARGDDRPATLDGFFSRRGRRWRRGRPGATECGARLKTNGPRRSAAPGDRADRGGFAERRCMAHHDHRRAPPGKRPIEVVRERLIDAEADACDLRERLAPVGRAPLPPDRVRSRESQAMRAVDAWRVPTLRAAGWDAPSDEDAPPRARRRRVGGGAGWARGAAE